MADVSTFLGEGAIPGQMSYKSLTTQTVLPDWYTNYAMQLLANQQQQMMTPYTAYQGPRVAEFSPMQEQAFGAVSGAATAYQPALNAATSATQNLMGQNALSGAQPYFTQAAGMSGAEAAQPFLGQGQQLTQQSTQALGMQAAQPYFSQATGLSGVAAAQPSLQQALGTAARGTEALGMQAAEPSFRAAERINSVGAASPLYQQAQGFIGQGTATGGLQAAQPLISQAAARATDVSDYMNPYIAQVVDRAGEMGARALREKLLPEIEGRYIRAGQLGFGPRGTGPNTPSGMMTDTARALRDVDENVRAQQAQLLSQGFTQAQGVAQTDLARQAQLAATTGQLGTAQQQALLEAAGQQAAMGTQLGQLTQAQMQALANIGAQRGQLGTAQQQALLEAAGQQAAIGQTLGNLTTQQQQALAQMGAQAGQLGTAQQQALAQAGQQMGALGQISGNLTTAQQQALANIGAQIGQIGGADLSRQLTGAGQLADMAAQAQALGLTGAGALQQMGALQQAQAQKNLDVAYADHLRQQGYNQEQINNALATFQGVAAGIPKATTEEGIVPSGDGAQKYEPGTFQTAASTATTLAGVYEKLKEAGIF